MAELTMLTTLYRALPVLIGLIIAVAARVLLRRGGFVVDLVPSSRRALALASGVPIALMIFGVTLGIFVSTLVIRPEGPVSVLPYGVAFALPLLAALIGLLILGIPWNRPSASGGAGLARRSALGFLPQVATIVLVVLIFASATLAVAGGRAPRPEELSIPPGTPAIEVDMTFSVEDPISGAWERNPYGWSTSWPSLVLLAVILAILIIRAILLARPGWEEDRRADSRLRRSSNRVGILIAMGGVSVHLGWVLQNLVRFSFSQGASGDGDGPLTLHGTHSTALSAPLGLAATTLVILGWGIWFWLLIAATREVRQER